MRLNNANHIKAVLIQQLMLLNKSSNVLFGNEFPFGTARRMSDIVMLNGKITGFEIKAENDDFRRFREQFDDYGKVFDYQYLVVTSRYLNLGKSQIGKKEGLILVNPDGSVKLIKRALLMGKQEKSEILASIPSKFLRKSFKVNSNIDAYTLRERLLKRCLRDLKSVFKAYVLVALGSRNKVFLSEVGCKVHFEDIKLLSANGSTVV